MAIPKLLVCPISPGLVSCPVYSQCRSFSSKRFPAYRVRSRSSPIRCHKMFVPGFPEMSPEAKAAGQLHNFFTYLAVKIVLAQLESYNTEGYQELMEFVNRTSLNDGDRFCASLMRESARHRGLAMRIMEVRSAYAQLDFEWEKLRKLALENANKSNKKLMRDYIAETSHVE